MKAAEFIRKVNRLANARKLSCRFDATRGKGSHGTLYFGDRRTVVPNLKKELKTGTMRAMLRQLGLTLDDLR